MNAKTLIASISLALVGVASHASEATQFVNEPSTLSRTEVRAELARAIARGELEQRGESYGSVAAHNLNRAAPLSRAAVIAELQQARADGSLDGPSDTYGSFRAGDFVSTLTRAEVRAQVRSGGLSRGERNHDVGG